MSKPAKLNKTKKIASAIALATITSTEDVSDDASMYTACVVYTILVNTELLHPKSGRDWKILQTRKNVKDPSIYFLCSNITAANAKEIRVEGEIYTLFLEKKRSLPEIGMCIYEPSSKNHPKLIERAMENIISQQAWIDKTMIAADSGKLQLLRCMPDAYETIAINDNKHTCILTSLNSTAPALYFSVVKLSDSSYCNLDSATLLCDNQVLGLGTLVATNKIYCIMAITMMHYLELLHNNENEWIGLVNFPIDLTEKSMPKANSQLPSHITLTHHTSGERWQLVGTDTIVRVGDHEVSKGQICVEPIGHCSVSAAIAHLFAPDQKIPIYVQRDGVVNQLNTTLTSMYLGRCINWSNLSSDLPKDVVADGLHFAQMTEERYNVIEGIWNFTTGYVRELLDSKYGKKTRPLFMLLPCRFSDAGTNVHCKSFVNDGTGYVLWQADGEAVTKIADFQSVFTRLNSGLVSQIELRGADDIRLNIKRTRGKWLVVDA
jgi:hypothetical protein